MSAPKRPKQAIIGPLNWELSYDAKRLKEGIHLDGVLRYGVTQPDQVAIVVDPDRPECGVRETLFHEVLHAVLWTIGYDFEDEDDEERLVASLSTAMLDMLQRNPELVAYLLPEAGS